MAVNNFFFDPKYQDFVPVTPEVDLRFIKDITDTYKKNSDALDSEKQSILNTLNSLDLHQTFNEDISKYIQDVNAQIDAIDSEYSGQLLDRNYQNKIRSLTRSVAGDPNLRYMIKTTEQLKKYEAARAASTDYLPFNDPDVAAYEAVLKREKDTRPTFGFTRIYADAKPETDLANVANAINIDENTELEFETVNGQRTGNVIAVDKKTREAKSIVTAMGTYMETFRNTAGGQQLQREAAALGTTYEELYVKKINGIAPILAVEKAKKALQADYSVQIDVQREKMAQDLVIASETLKAKEQESKDKYILELIKMAYDAKKSDDHLNYLYDQLNQQGYNIDRQTFEAMYKQQGSPYSSTNRTGSRGGGGSSGGDASGYTPTNPYTTPLRMTATTTGFAIPVPDDKSTYEGMRNTLNNLKNRNTQIRDANKLSIIQVPIGMSSLSPENLIDKYATGTAAEKEALGRLQVGVNVSNGTQYMPLSEAIKQDAAVLEFYNNAIKSKLYSDEMYDIEKKAAELFVQQHGGIDSESVKSFLHDGILKVIPADNSYPEHLVLDEDGIMNSEQVLTEIRDIEQSNKQIKFYLNSTPNKKEAVYASLKDLREIAGGSSTVKAKDVPSLQNQSDYMLSPVRHDYTHAVYSINITPEIAARIIADHKVEVAEKYFGNVIKDMQSKRKLAHEEIVAAYGVVSSGLSLNPAGNGPEATRDANFESTINATLISRKFYDKSGRQLVMYDQQLYQSTATGERTGKAIGYVQPYAITLSPQGEFVVHYNTYDINPKESAAKRVGNPIYSIETPENIQAAYFTPLFQAEYGHDIGTFASAQLDDNAAWVAANFRPSRTSNKPIEATTKYPHIQVVKNVDKTYSVLNSETRETRLGIKTDMELITVLSLIDYAEANKPSLRQSPQMPTGPRYGPANTPLDIPTMIENFKNVRRNVYGEPNADGYVAPTIDELVRRVKAVRTGVPQSTPANTQPASSPTSSVQPVNSQEIAAVTANLDQTFAALLKAESGGNSKEVNRAIQPETGRPTYAAGKWQFVPSQTYDIVKTAAKNLGLGNDFQIWDDLSKQPGKDFEAFLYNPGLQDEAMRILVNKNTQSWNSLPQEYKDKLEARYPGAALQKYLEMAHAEGSAGVKAVFDYWWNDAEKPKNADRLEAYMKRIGDIEISLSTPQPTSSGLDYQLRNVPAGTQITLQDGSTYKKENPKGVIDDNSEAIVKSTLKKYIRNYISKELETNLGGDYNNKINAAIAQVIKSAKDADKDLLEIIINESLRLQVIDAVISYIENISYIEKAEESEATTTTSQTPATEKPDYSWYTPKYKYISESPELEDARQEGMGMIIHTPGEITDASIVSDIMDIGIETEKNPLLADHYASEFLHKFFETVTNTKNTKLLLEFKNMTYEKFVSGGYQDMFRELYKAINEGRGVINEFRSKVGDNPASYNNSLFMTGKAALDSHLWTINPNLPDWIRGIDPTKNK